MKKRVPKRNCAANSLGPRWNSHPISFPVLTYHDRTTVRFVILHHQLPTSNHWDVMLEMDSALITWSIPPQCPSGTSFTCPANRLSDHRKHYLDYEGEVSDNRGVVSRIDTGTYEQLSPEQFFLYGTNFSGKLTMNGNMMIFEHYRTENGT